MNPVLHPLLCLVALPQAPAIQEAVVLEVQFVALDEQRVDDAVPLPTPAVVSAGASHDTLLEPASGDPYFLGFVAGKHYPPAGERLDPELLAALRSNYADGRPSQETYAFVMFDKRITAKRLELLSGAGARVLEFHPHHCLKVALAPLALDAVAALDFVRWVGVPRHWQKLHTAAAPALAALREGEWLEAYVNLYESDACEQTSFRTVGAVSYGGPDGVFEVLDPQFLPKVWMSHGWQQRALQSLGVDVREYVDSIHAFRVRVAPNQVESLLALDFVQFVEPVNRPRTMHDESMPMILADRTRIAYDGASTSIVGQGDSGLDSSHQGLDHIYWWATDLAGLTEPAWVDACTHGSHVAGTILGSGDVEDSFRGAAPRVGNLTTTRFFNTKMFYDSSCWVGGGATMAAILDSFDSSVTDGSGNVTQRPHVINQSWGSDAPFGGAFGSEADCRMLDNNTFGSTQLHVFAAGNSGSGARTINVEASAKNVLAVGGVRDYFPGSFVPGDMYLDSSRGPTADNRWKPNLVAPATIILSVAAGTTDGYATKSGTSMAAPHVTGVCAQLVDHYSYLRHNATTLGALLMASAMTRSDQLLGAPSADPAHHLNNWGAGRVEAYKAHHGPGAISFSSWTQTPAAGAYVDVPVGVGATRLAVCLYYHEAAASSGASSALLNDLDLWLDSPTGGINAVTNSGEFSAQQSPRDNVEIRLLDNPVAGTWRIKVHPDGATSNCRVGLAVLAHYDDTTPSGTFDVSASKLFAKPGEALQITATATNPAYVASAVGFDSTSSGDLLSASTAVLADGATASFLHNYADGRDVMVGDIEPGGSRSVTWTTSWASEGFQSFTVATRSENWADSSDVAIIGIDGTPPPVPTNVVSTTHTPGQWTNDTTISYSWSQPADNLSGIDGYGLYTTLTGPSTPGATKDIGPGSTYSETLTQGSWTFNLRPLDRSGNWSPSFASAGPFRIDTTNPAAAAGLSSSTHAPNVVNCATNVTVNWTAAVDSGGAGVAGYAGVWDTLPFTVPLILGNFAATATSYSADIGSSASARYFHLRTIDNAGNYGGTAHFGPVFADAMPVASYCSAKVNSLGCTPTIGTNGVPPSRSAGNFTVTCTSVINQKNGLLFFGFAPLGTPFQGGTLCVASPTIRTPSQSSGGAVIGANCSGSYSFTFTTPLMTLLGLDPGETVYAQYWMRDPNSPSTTGLSRGLRFTICD